MAREWHYMTPPPRFERVIVEGKKKVEKCHCVVYTESRYTLYDIAMNVIRTVSQRHGDCCCTRWVTAIRHE